MTLVGHAMRPVWRFLRRSPAEQWLLVRTFVLLLIIAIAIRTVRLASLQQALSRLARRPISAPRREQPALDTLVWAVAVASRYVPRATCLVRALALQVLLNVHGWPSRLRVGIRQLGDGAVTGHAWVEQLDGLVISDEAPIAYTPLPLVDEVTSNGA